MGADKYIVTQKCEYSASILACVSCSCLAPTLLTYSSLAVAKPSVLCIEAAAVSAFEPAAYIVLI